MSEDEYGDLPLPELIAKANDAIDAGFTVYFKFTCDNCNERLTFFVPNTLYTSGTCEMCGHITAIKKGGFLVVRRLVPIEHR
jgi:hypothetical protein